MNEKIEKIRQLLKQRRSMEAMRVLSEIEQDLERLDELETKIKGQENEQRTV